jgi:hypothetical protein
MFEILAMAALALYCLNKLGINTEVNSQDISTIRAKAAQALAPGEHQ